MKSSNPKWSFIVLTALSLFIFLISLFFMIGEEKNEMAESTNRVIEIPSN